MIKKAAAALLGLAVAIGLSGAAAWEKSFSFSSEAGVDAITQATQRLPLSLVMRDASGKTISDGGYANKSVTINILNMQYQSYTSRSLALNGAAISWPSGGTVDKSGRYEVSVTGEDGYTDTSSFIIDKTRPAISATAGGRKIAGGTASKVKIKALATDKHLKSKSVKRNGNAVSWPSTGVFSTKGSYVLTAIDKAGNKTTFKFSII